jgi:hypothetical protein
MTLYLELMEGKVAPDENSPTGTVIRYSGTGKCAVFDEKMLDKMIVDTWKRYKKLKELKNDATHHIYKSTLEEIRRLNVPYTVKTLVKKQC